MSGIHLPDGIHPDVAKAYDKWGIKDLYPPQRDALEPISRGKNVVAAVPTAAGKSLIAYTAVLNHVLKGGKALYIVPLRALASEKFRELSELSSFGIRTALSYGDYDDEDRRLESFDVVVATSEKADSLLRHRSRWLMNIKVIVSDEVHLLNDPGRGPTLEVILTRFRQLNPKAQLVCLSATIGNADEIAGWLDAELVRSDFRPVDLREGVLEEGSVTFEDMSVSEIESRTGDPLKDGILDGISDGRGQVLVFTNTRRSCESQAVEMAKIVPSYLEGKDLSELSRLSAKLGSSDARMIKKLKKAISGGCGFHHAGLSNDQRGIVERAFRERRIKVLFATPTLAAGINLPARRVIVRDWTRFEALNPRSPIPVLEIKQMLGRAGRPGFDRYGQGLILARRPEELDVLMERYIWGKPEDVLSKLGSRPALRMHILSSFATNYVRDLEEMWDFIRSTFYAFQNDTWKIEGEVEDVLDFLKEEGFLIEKDGALAATDLGKRVARLYIDPLSAVVIRRALDSGAERVTPFSLLHVICHTPDMRPLYIRGKERDRVSGFMYEHEDELMLEIPEDPVELDWYLNSVKTAMFFLEWIGENEHGIEASEERMETLFNMGPGDVRSKVETAVWMLHAMRELSRLFGKKMAKDIDLLSLRVDRGIRSELVPLISLKGIGRVRARRLFEAGFTNLDKLRRASVNRIATVEGIGRQTALTIQNQLSDGSEPLAEDEAEDDQGTHQSILFDFQ
ncbi:hypothetical protein B6U90_03695 [Thermoplasmatales archaeon ex4484_6]|nr:MAG: hypothetical protein B6U90_03695 [Thermoplasmatales archaeon ex4484_6]